MTQGVLEADAWPGPSLVIAYSTCIAHGIDMSTSMTHQKDAVKSGYWPLYRFQPTESEDGHPFRLPLVAHHPQDGPHEFALLEGLEQIGAEERRVHDHQRNDRHADRH